MAAIIYKPQTSKGPIILLPKDVSTPPTITLPDGTVIQAIKGDRAGGVYKGEEGYQWVFPETILNVKDAILKADGKEQKLGNTNLSYRGDFLGSLKESNKGAIGDTTPKGSVNNFNAVGDYGIAPEYIGNLFPRPATIAGASQDYQYVDPIKFGKEFNPYQREELSKNFKQAEGFALDTIDNEFQGLSSFVPKSSALKREQTALDNTFNQSQRTAQIQSTIPDVVSDLNRQAADARTYASGEVPNSVIDRALEVGTRSAAADIATTSGFGVGSSAARKLSDLMSAKDRLGLAQYGESLLSTNAAQRAELNLAPTSYSNAGQQVNVSPTISTSQLSQANFGAINNAINLPATSAYTGTIGQSQFVSGLQQQTQEFNANNVNNFALSFFNYLNSYANSVAGAGQTNINTMVGLDQQQAAKDTFNENKHDTQHANDIINGINTIGAGSGLISTVLSDTRLKEDIYDYNSGIEDLNKLKIIHYKYKKGTVADDGAKPHIGVIAQELQKIFPSSVGKHSSGYLQIDPSEIIFALVKTVQDLQAQINDLKRTS